MREYSARNWSTERIRVIDAEEVDCGGGASVAAAEEAMVESGGADVAGRSEASSYGCGEVGRGEVEGPVAIIGVVVVRMGEEVVVTGSETGSEICGGDGTIGSTGCTPSLPITPWSAADAREVNVSFLVGYPKWKVRCSTAEVSLSEDAKV